MLLAWIVVQVIAENQVGMSLQPFLIISYYCPLNFRVLQKN